MTFWMVILTLISPLVYKYIDLVFLSMLCLITATFIGYVYPGRFSYIDNGTRKYIQDYKKHIVHILFHVLPFLFILWKYYNTYNVKHAKHAKHAKHTNGEVPLVIAVSILILYISLMKPNEVYELDGIAFAWLFIATIAIYMAIYI